MKLSGSQLSSAVKSIPASNIQVKNNGLSKTVTIKLNSAPQASKLNAKA